MHKKNIEEFNGEPFSIFGRGYEEIINDNGDSEIVDHDYYIDSIVLYNGECYNFFIRCINSEGNIVEL